jgi:thymidylate synthase ThyX
LAEMQEIGKRAHEELAQVIPSFIRRSDPSHHTHQGLSQFYEAMETEQNVVTSQHVAFSERSMEPGVRLVDYDSDSVINVAAALLFSHCDKGLKELREYCRELPEEELTRILDAACNARENRRHKSPRALENAFFTFEIISDFGIYRDLHRHRMLTQERQLLCTDYGYYTPPEIVGMDIEDKYHKALHKASETFSVISQELPEEAQYVVPMAYNVRWYFHVNLRALQWLCELRSAAAGHPQYRYIAQSMAKQASEVFPAFERFFKFVDYDGYDMGRIGQEQRKVEKQQQMSSQ